MKDYRQHLPRPGTVAYEDLPQLVTTPPLPLAGQYAARSCTRSFPWPKPPSMKWSDAVNSPAASSWHAGAWSGIWRKWRPGSKIASGHPAQAKLVPRRDRTCGNAFRARCGLATI